jgi:hypothetical protein
MSFGVQFTGLKQQPPLTATKATIIAQFAALGVRPDLVQVYAVNLGETDPGGLGDLVDTVDLTIPDPTYASVFTVPAGYFYRIWLCPRSGSKESPEDTTDGVYWETYCVWETIVAQAAPAPGAQRVPPSISGLDAEPATATQPDRITVKWQSPQSYDKYLIWWTEDGQAMDQGEVDGTATAGSWTASPTVPGRTYTFSVKGGVSGGILGNYLYSDWSPAIKLVAPAHRRSLRQFLVASGVNLSAQGVKALLKRQKSLRGFMKV